MARTARNRSGQNHLMCCNNSKSSTPQLHSILMLPRCKPKWSVDGARIPWCAGSPIILAQPQGCIPGIYAWKGNRPVPLKTRRRLRRNTCIVQVAVSSPRANQAEHLSPRGIGCHKLATKAQASPTWALHRQQTPKDPNARGVEEARLLHYSGQYGVNPEDRASILNGGNSIQALGLSVDSRTHPGNPAA